MEAFCEVILRIMTLLVKKKLFAWVMHITFINYSPELNGCSHSLVSNDSRHGYADKLTEVVDRAHHRELPFFFLAHKSKLYNISRKYNTNIY